MRLSVSQEQTYRKCRRAWYYKYNLGYKPVVEQPWLTAGKVYEEMLYIFHKRGYEAAKSFINMKVSDQFKVADMEFILDKIQENNSKSILEFTNIAGKPGYQFEFNIPFKVENVSNHEVIAHGFFDDVVKTDKGICVFEGKTTSEPIEFVSEYWKKLDMDPQVSCYAWAASKCMGYPINWVMYHVIRKPNFTKTHKVKGVDVPYTLEEYKERMRDEKKTYVAYKMIYVSDERQRLWALEHAKTNDEIMKDLELSEILEFIGYENEIQFSRSFNHCDEYGGCPYREACNLSKDIKNIDTLKKEDGYEFKV